MLRIFYGKFCRNFTSNNKMSSKKHIVKKSKAAPKVSKKNKIIKPILICGPHTEKPEDLPDIEDVIPQIRYFSPLQTRRQCQSNNPLERLKSALVAAKKPTKLFPETAEAQKAAHATAELQTCNEPDVEGSVGIKMEIMQPNKLEQQKPIFSKYFTKTEIIDARNSDYKLPTIDDIPENKYNLEWAPSNWYTALQNIRLMRRRTQAPVDNMGCHQCADNEADEKTQRFHKLVALMLSSQTKDETTFAAMERLKQRTLTPKTIIDIPSDELEQLICPVSFYKNKSKYLKQTAQKLIDRYGGDIPNNVKELIALPGVGPKMAHICMATAWQQITGIGVDVHVHRITNRLGWVPKPTKEPEQTRNALEAWLPRELWAEVNHLLVGFGQTICTPVRPHCADCLNAKFCPAVDIKVNAKAKQKASKKATEKPKLCPAIEKFEKKLLKM